MRERSDEIEAAGARLVVVGNGAPHFAAAFHEEFALTGPLLVDRELSAYRAAGLRRGRVEILSPRLPLHAARAWLSGARQTAVEGDPWQLGGVFVIRPGGALGFEHVSREAGDHPSLDAVIAALAPGAPELSETPHASPLTVGLGHALSALVDPTIVLSFDRTGHRIHSLRFRPDDLEVDLAGRRILVTGANSGIGFAAALALADLGAELILLCRSRERGDAAAAAIRQQTGNTRVRCQPLDVSSLADVRRVAAELAQQKVDVLVHNAGVLPTKRQESADGLELTFATHVAGPFLLTRLLQPALARSSDARVVWVSSGGMYTRRLDLSDIGWNERDYDGVIAYAETKRAQVVLAELWAERLRDQSICVSSMHPGWADTPSVRSSLPGFHRLTRFILRTPAEGADTVVWLAASPSARGATRGFFFDRAARRTHLLPFTRESGADREALWDLCERVTAANPEAGPARESA